MALTVYKTSNCNGSAGTTSFQAADASGYLNAAATLRVSSMNAVAGTANFTASNIVYTTSSVQTSETVYYGASSAGLVHDLLDGFCEYQHRSRRGQQTHFLDSTDGSGLDGWRVRRRASRNRW